MSVTARLGAFAFALLLTLGGGYALGAAVGPVDPPEPAPGHTPARTTPSTTAPTHGDHAGMSR